MHLKSVCAYYKCTRIENVHVYLRNECASEKYMCILKVHVHLKSACESKKCMCIQKEHVHTKRAYEQIICYFVKHKIWLHLIIILFSFYGKNYSIQNAFISLIAKKKKFIEKKLEFLGKMHFSKRSIYIIYKYHAGWYQSWPCSRTVQFEINLVWGNALPRNTFFPLISTLIKYILI